MTDYDLLRHLRGTVSPQNVLSRIHLPSANRR